MLIALALVYVAWMSFVVMLIWKVRLKSLIKDARASWSPTLAKRYALAADEARINPVKMIFRYLFLISTVFDALRMLVLWDPNPVNVMVSIVFAVCLYADCVWPRDPGMGEPQGKVSNAT